VLTRTSTRTLVPMKAFASNAGNWETFNLSRFALRSSLKTKPQVEYYFSDENLPTDLHLLQCCGGRDNLGVSIGRINGFKKMRKFKKKVIVEAARAPSSRSLTMARPSSGRYHWLGEPSSIHQKMKTEKLLTTLAPSAKLFIQLHSSRKRRPSTPQV
jgi:hypothetical protein